MTARDAVYKEFAKGDDADGLYHISIDEIVDEIIRLRRIEAAAMAVIQQMRRYLPTPGESAGETKISVSAWTALMKQIEYAESLTEAPTDG